jgi:uncharacterized protein (DUF2267 family)
MTYEEFVGHVQHRAHLPSQEAGLRAARATLETLSERIEPGAAAHLAAQLPRELGRFLTTPSEFRRLSLKEFFESIQQREGDAVDLPAAVYHARVVFEVLQEAVAPGTIQKIRSELPAEYTPLFDAGSQGPLYKETPTQSP